jgi:hypothetical protein
MFISERSLNYSLALSTLINRIPGVRLVAQKREHFFIINKYKNLFMPNSDKYFPETFLIPEDYQTYKKIHSQNPKRVYIAKTSKGTQGKNIHLLPTPEAFKGLNTQGI